MNKIKQVLGSQWFHSLWHAMLGGGTTYIGSNGFIPSKSWAFGLAGAILGGLVGWLNGNAANGDPQQPASSSASKTGMVLIGFLLLSASPSFASTIFTYGGGLNISKQTLSAPTPGLYSFPVIGLTGSVISYQDNEFKLAPEVGLSGALVIGDCVAKPDDSTGGVDFEPTGFLFGLDAGGGAFQSSPDGGTYVGKGFIGLCVFDPKDFGNFGIAVNQTFDGPFNPTVWALFVQSFDVAGGIPVTKLR